MLDFAAPLGLSADRIRPDISATGGVRIGGIALYPLPDMDDTLRLSFVLTPEDSAESAELRVTLQGDAGEALVPVWLYRWTRAEGGGV